MMVAQWRVAMYRSLLALFVAVTVTKDGAVLFFPTKEGAKLVYEFKINDKTEELTDTVTKVEVCRVTFLSQNRKEKG
jgi:hypothetical protein